MKAVVITQFGEPSVFHELEMAGPDLKPGYVLVRVLATSVNPIDTKIRSGMVSQIAPDFPAVLHGDFSGIIEKLGDGVEEFSIGDEVFGCAGGLKGEGGALAEFMLVDARLIAKSPVSISLAQAAALPLVCITAWEALFEKIKLSPNQTILVHGGAGGVGHIGIQLAKWAGAKVYATVSSNEKAEIAKSLGAIDVINYKEESVTDYVSRLTDGRGFDVVFDTIGGVNIDQSLAAVAMYGNVITILSHSTHDLSLLQAKSASIHGVFMLLPLLYNIQRERHGKIMKNIAKLVDDGYLKPLIDSRQFTFDQVDKAHALLESGGAIGKIIIRR